MPTPQEAATAPDSALAELASVGLTGVDDPRAVKLYADGAPGCRGAPMLKPYSDDARNSGLLFHKPADLTARISKALGKGYQVGIHAIGDASNREVLDSYAAAYKIHPEGIKLRNRVEHAQIFSLQDIPASCRRT